MSLEEKDSLLSNPLDMPPNYSTSASTADFDIDPMIKDKKQLELSSIEEVLPLFLLNTIVIAPLWLLLLVPMTVVYQCGNYVCNSVMSTKRDKSSTPPNTSTTRTHTVEKQDRTFDIVVFGATGFTGQLVVDYIAKNYGTTSFKWAIGGRRMDALSTIQSKIRQKYPNITCDVPCIIADSSDRDSLEKLVTSTKIVITTAGAIAFDLLLF